MNVLEKQELLDRIDELESRLIGVRCEFNYLRTMQPLVESAKIFEVPENCLLVIKSDRLSVEQFERFHHLLRKNFKNPPVLACLSPGDDIVAVMKSDEPTQLPLWNGETVDPSDIPQDLWGGIDPGSKGAMAVTDGKGFVDFILFEKATERDIYLWAERYKSRIRWVLLEQVSAMKGWGVSSTFKFGMSYGAMRMLLTALGVPWETITPVPWMNEMKCRPKKKADKSKMTQKAAAQRLFPWVTRITKDNCDALLISECSRRRWNDGN